MAHVHAHECMMHWLQSTALYSQLKTGEYMAARNKHHLALVRTAHDVQRMRKSDSSADSGITAAPRASGWRTAGSIAAGA